MSRLKSGLVCAVLALSSAVGGTASAAPPEGCIGFPDIPSAFVCITRFTPASAVPTVAPGPSQTYTIPEFCVFECFGPTPVSVPGVVITEGDGIVAEIQYDGDTYQVTVPSAGSIPETVQQAQQAVSDAVATIFGLVEDAGEETGGAHAFAFTATLHIGCYGCGIYGPDGNSLSGSVTGVASGQTFVQAPMTATFTLFNPVGVTCMISSTAAGTMYLPSPLGNTDFILSYTGAFWVMTYDSRDGVHSGTAMGTLTVTSPVGNPCGWSVEATINGVATGAF